MKKGTDHINGSHARLLIRGGLRQRYRRARRSDAPDTDKTTSEAESVTSADYIYPTADYGGFEFTFLNIEPEIWANVMIAPEEI